MPEGRQIYPAVYLDISLSIMIGFLTDVVDTGREYPYSPSGMTLCSVTMSNRSTRRTTKRSRTGGGYTAT